MIKLEKMVKKLELILAGVMLPTMIIFVVLELNRLMTGTETDYGYLAITMIMTLLLGTLEVQFSMKEEIREEETEVTDEIVKVLYYDIKPMTPEDAKLKLQEQPQNRFLAFIDIDTGKTNIIYRLKDNKNFGLVEPEG